MSLSSRAFILALAFIAHSASAQVSEASCGSLANAFGPFDYRSNHFKLAPGDNMPHAEKLRLVEIGHFTPPVESLVRGQTAHHPGPDLDYTLRAFPNHHRALVTMMRLWERVKIPTPPGLGRPAECYFERAVRFVPDDTTSRLIYATFLIRAKRNPEAQQQLRAALMYAEDSAYTHYNIGMVYADAGEFDAALAQAHKAMALGFTRSELRDRLVAAGKWRDPAATAAPAAAAAASSAAPAASAPT